LTNKNACTDISEGEDTLPDSHKSKTGGPAKVEDERKGGTSVKLIGFPVKFAA
jgi:hypothetical protein